MQQQRPTWGWQTALLLVGLLVSTCVTAQRPLPRAQAAGGPSGAVPPMLPAHLILGLANSPGDLGWMTGSGIHWNARYQYLSGGVNTGSGWTTWNSPAGAFALWYMQTSGADGYLPVFSYYQILQSRPAAGTTEAGKDYSNLNNAATMKAYYGEFKLLMDQARTYGKPVIVQIEPDLWGYLEQKAGSCGHASCVSAAVASSGYAAASAFPNTAQGFAEALLHLRDAYAPKALLAIHASCWGSRADVCGYPTSAADTAAHAAHDASFLRSAGIAGNPAGVSSWDLVFTDTLDRDAGYYQYVYGNPHAWWDPTNQTLPNFANFRTWVAGINSGTVRRIVLWQTPVGNQYFKTDNNMTGHYQDNRAQYFLGDGPSYRHLQDFAGAGVVGLLFGAGASGPTTYTDAQHDGITNPAPVTSFQCAACNTHTSSWSDDDGGYLRLFGGAYLRAGGVLLPRGGAGGIVPPPPATGGPTLTSAPATGVVAAATPVALAVLITHPMVQPRQVSPGGRITFSATITTARAARDELVDFEVYGRGGVKVGQVYRTPLSFTAGRPTIVSASWMVPPAQAAGHYTLKVGVFTAAWSLQTRDDAAGIVTVAPAH